MDRPESSGTASLLNAQRNFEKRFSCPICLEPKLKMVVSSCQHRICTDCLYDNDNKLNKAMAKCPTCQRENVHPKERPDIPEDNIEIQRQLGVTQCPMDGCDAGLWIWDVEKHIESCSYAVISPKPGTKRKREQKVKEHKNKSDSPKTKQQKTKSPPKSKGPGNTTPSNKTPAQGVKTPPRQWSNTRNTTQYQHRAAREWSPQQQVYNNHWNVQDYGRNHYQLRSQYMQGPMSYYPMYRQ